MVLLLGKKKNFPLPFLDSSGWSKLTRDRLTGEKEI